MDALSNIISLTAKCPSTDDYQQNVIYCTAIKRKYWIHVKHGLSLKIFYLVCAEAIPKDHIIYDSIQMECPEQVHLQKQSMNGYQGLGDVQA